ncbi:probable LRR receptor-like serine/threonine-protein kinase [Tanacetum coccineum]
MGPTHWATIVISDANTIESQELIFLASNPTVSVCLSNSTTGLPFISTLELRRFNGSVYLTPYEEQFFLSVSARINFGAENEDPVRHLENNQLSGHIPSSLANLPNLSRFYTGNENLHKGSSGGRHNTYIILGLSLSLLHSYRIQSRSVPFANKKRSQASFHVTSKNNATSDGAQCFTLSEIQFGRPRLDKKLGPLAKERKMKWLERLEIADDAAKGIEYLHTGCIPSIIHRDLKSSNILLDKNMKAKVSDFGLSKLAVDGISHVSSIVRGTVGYLDPEYYISNHLTEKSDIYSFGVILLELISGKEAISNESFGMNCRNIVQWARLHIENGDIQGIIDPSLGDEYDIQSMWKLAEKALMCVQPHANSRPSMSEVIKEIQDAIMIERGVVGGSSEEISRNSFHSSLNMGSLDTGVDPYVSFHASTKPSAR